MPGGIPFANPDDDNLASRDYPPVATANRFSQDAVIGALLFGWNATLKFYGRIGIANVEERVRRLGTYATERLQDIDTLVELQAAMRHEPEFAR